MISTRNVLQSDNNQFIQACDNYLGARTGCYEFRRERYIATVDKMIGIGLSDSDTVYDIGAGWTEFDYCLRTEGGFKGRYIPVDGGIDGTDLEVWTPPRAAEWFIALELVEHLANPGNLISNMQRWCKKAIIISTPNPHTTDVLGMDHTHKTEIWPQYLQNQGFEVASDSFYGKPNDSLFAWWIAP